MQQRNLGTSGLSVGAIGLGCMGLNWAYNLGRANTNQESIHLIRRAIDLGVTLIDTADVYGPFTNEELVGEALTGRRNEVVLATKGGYIVEDIPTIRLGRNGTPEHLKAACEASLRRLKTDVIDLYQLHRPDPNVPIEESVGALAELKAAGKIRAIGLSECSLDLLERAIKVAPIATLQSEFSLWTRDVQAEILPWCKQHNVGFLPFAPLGRGFLTGRYRSTENIPANDLRANMPRFQPEAFKTNLQIVDQVTSVADRLNATPAQVALAWILAQGDQIVPIPGTKQIPYLEENIGAAEVKLSSEDLALLNSIPAPVGTRY
jgi:aryl-alcohol dehydrogenase-like predicted oxidoreductase